MNRFRFGLGVVLALAFSAFAATPALADDGPQHPRFDPLTANVPYLAWRGEQVRLVKCDITFENGIESTGGGGDGSLALNADWIVEDWSGYPFQPPSLEQSTVKFFRARGDRRDAPCVKANFVSLKAGLAIIKLVITDAATGNPLVKHQFLVGWLGLNEPVIDSPLDGLEDVPGGLGNRLRARLTGALPLGNNFVELGLPPSIQLPAEADGSTYWDELAVALATTSDPRPFYRDAPWRMWDIHDDQLLTEGHVDADAAVFPDPYGGPCPPEPPSGTPTRDAAIDAVDNCPGFQGDDGQFSRIWGDLTNGGGGDEEATEGPFDPVRFEQTFLGDGKLDAGDVPLPAARVDFSIAANSGAPTDISGVGSFTDANKGSSGDGFREIYERRQDALVDDDDPHNLYAPYYQAYIPAVRGENDGDGTSSGTDTAGTTNNYPNFLTCIEEENGSLGGPIGDAGCEYDYWTIELDLRTAAGGSTDCLRRLDAQPAFRQLPFGPQAVVVYSDEHGEAWVQWLPGLGFFFDNLGVGTNLNNACDLRGVDVLGTADIQAIARYPGQKTTDPDKPSNVLTKTVGNLFSKEVTCVPKGPVPPVENSLAFICTATAIDIDGSPFAGEKVCFMTNGEGARPFPLGTPSTQEGLHRLCVITNAQGQAAIEVFGKCLQGNVIVEFVKEGIIRFATFPFGCPPGAGGGTQVSAAQLLGVDPKTLVPGMSPQQTQQALAQARAKAKPKAKAKKATLAFARIQVKSFQKRDRRLVVRVNSPARTARIQVTLISASGKVIGGRLVRTVPTNRAVRVPNLKLPKAAKTARVKVLG